uniref:Uncharacterized protein n=1 Tax=Clastoptera arizonana TaxID=38151 RepID=A0A1B6CL65_9HEMI
MSTGLRDENYLSRSETLQLRNRYIAESCELHFNSNPLKIIRSRGQYLYDEENNEYLDFVSKITNVGHCNEEVVKAACFQMTRLSMAVGGEATMLQEKYTKQLLETLPENFEVVLYTNSGAEANDLALQMMRNYTGTQDVVVVDGAFHGTGNLLVDISPRAFKATPEGKKPWVHVIPVPDTFRGPYKADDPQAAELYFQDAKTVISRILSNNRKIGGFISEPVFIVHGLLIPPPGWLPKIYSYIRELGGIVIADEIQSGMGRTGYSYWGFESQNAVPDILTVGKPMGNGHPIGAVITSRRIAESIINAEQIVNKSISFVHNK